MVQAPGDAPEYYAVPVPMWRCRIGPATHSRVGGRGYLHLYRISASQCSPH